MFGRFLHLNFLLNYSTKFLSFGLFLITATVIPTIVPKTVPSFLFFVENPTVGSKREKKAQDVKKLQVEKFQFEVHNEHLFRANINH